MTPCEERGWKEGDLFIVMKGDFIGRIISKGEIIKLIWDDGTHFPKFRYEQMKHVFGSVNGLMRASDHFSDIDNPTKSERLMFKLNYGFDPYE